MCEALLHLLVMWSQGLVKDSSEDISLGDKEPLWGPLFSGGKAVCVCGGGGVVCWWGRDALVWSRNQHGGLWQEEGKPRRVTTSLVSPDSQLKSTGATCSIAHLDRTITQSGFILHLKYIWLSVPVSSAFMDTYSCGSKILRGRGIPLFQKAKFEFAMHR